MSTSILEKFDSDSRSDASSEATFSQRLTRLLRNYGVETHGFVCTSDLPRRFVFTDKKLNSIAPVPKEERTDTRLYDLFLLGFSSNMDIPNLALGAGGPVVFNLSPRSTAIILVISNALAAIIPAYLAIFGPKLGTRAMVQARFSWGVYAVAVPSILNVLSTMGFPVLGAIVGGQMLATTSDKLTPATGIVIIALVSLARRFESVAWIPPVVGLAVMVGVGGKHLGAGPAYPPPTAASIISRGAPWCTVTPDYGVFHDANASSASIFTYTYLGLFLPNILLRVLGAAFAAAAPGVPSWNAGYDNGNDLGGLVSAVLAPCGRFGTCLIVLMALAISAPSAPMMYSFGISLMNINSAFCKVPRYIYIIGYWSASYAGIVVTEHVVFRRCDLERYALADWEDARKLPPGLAALLAFVASFACIVPCMAQTYYVGPVANVTGDIGLVVGFFSACVVYGALRPFKIRCFPGHSS
ncbi:permease for cytosine/purines, uracil, thiamine, allantoin-domain-containing protein [Mycena rosella]|uniref:Permease for cytosine/purines, uracil, thiamine, allantoin-domain-containing protein n=1 Tax=Mycena rosella TaxID=1033263 RepID=A0AAD7G9F1_MYCRO|nr:permease for cytosine/purines, uracil, thiamine, allantoin-domain-containing protein [Mycena rosella]